MHFEFKEYYLTMLLVVSYFFLFCPGGPFKIGSPSSNFSFPERAVKSPPLEPMGASKIETSMQEPDNSVSPVQRH